MATRFIPFDPPDGQVGVSYSPPPPYAGEGEADFLILSYFDLLYNPGEVGVGYVIQIATSPAFGAESIVCTLIPVDGIAEHMRTAVLETALSPRTTYFWRIGTRSVTPPFTELYFPDDQFSCFVTTLPKPILESVIGDQAIAGDTMTVTWTPTTDSNITHVRINYNASGEEPSSIDFPREQNTGRITALATGETYTVTAQTKGYLEFDYDMALAGTEPQLTTIITNDGTEVTNSHGSMVVSPLR